MRRQALYLRSTTLLNRLHRIIVDRHLLPRLVDHRVSTLRHVLVDVVVVHRSMSASAVEAVCV